MKKFLAVIVAVFFVFAFYGVAMAADAAQPAATAQAKAQHPAGPIQKLERGVNNFAFGWTEIPKRIVDVSKQSNPIKGVLLGTFQGSCKAFARTASGAADVVSFPIGSYDKPKVLPDMPAAK
ncbi:MAG TPA: exosortase system-associated protein, TIGR04073 family [Candidatus Omnitrophota bacterium]|nr:exosortase system-associated protein, TIGR04073 family [Candidatus Omnitrophota bacterium]HPS20824.1 exosortase system-associated protein, TIGR04073 family [Candidatus Omnitrophota bacterium]